MVNSSSELKEKDVVNVCDGRRLGFICDFSVDTDSGKICAIFVSDHIFGFASSKNMLKICWDKITCIGEDTILVNVGIGNEHCRDECRCDDKKKKKGGWFFS